MRLPAKLSRNTLGSRIGLALPLVLLAAGCKGAEDAPAPSTVSRAEAPVRVTTSKTELSIPGLVDHRTETTVVEPAYRPAVIEDRGPTATPSPAPQSGLLTAGDVDDLLNPGQYARYATHYLQTSGQKLDFVDTRSRVVLRVLDRRGQPVPFARISVRRNGTPLQVTTVADGTASVYPRMDGVPESTVLDVRSAAGSAVVPVRLHGQRLIPVSLGGVATPPAAMDLAIVVDTTGSMGDEMAFLRAELDAIIARLQRNAGNVSLRIGVVLFRDDGDDYVVRTAPLTERMDGVRHFIADQDAGGGGDAPEALDQAVAASTRLQWRSNAAKAVLLVTDAPPHGDRIGRTLALTQGLRAQGVQVIPVGASGVDDDAQYVLRSMAALTQGRYIFLTDDSGVGDGHAEPDVACYQVTRLDQLIARVLASVATGRRVEARPDDVIRNVGTYDRGQCLAPGQIRQE